VVEEPTDSDTPLGLRPGSRFGHYRLRRLLGRGGFGEVYEAQDNVMDRVVAVKLLAAPYSQNQVFRQRLYREARAAGRLHEPHLLPIGLALNELPKLCFAHPCVEGLPPAVVVGRRVVAFATARAAWESPGPQRVRGWFADR